MITLQEINEENFYKIINLELSHKQQGFVASNVQSLAECYLYRKNNDVFPYSISYNDTPVGFLLIYTDEDEKSLTVWRFMIDKKFQHRGYGRQAILLIEEAFRSKGNYEFIVSTYKPDNMASANLFKSLGYLQSSINAHDEIVVKKKL